MDSVIFAHIYHYLNWCTMQFYMKNCKGWILYKIRFALLNKKESLLLRVSFLYVIKLFFRRKKLCKSFTRLSSLTLESQGPNAKLCSYCSTDVKTLRNLILCWERWSMALRVNHHLIMKNLDVQTSFAKVKWHLLSLLFCSYKMKIESIKLF